MSDHPADPFPPRGHLRRRVLAGEPTVGAFVQLGSPVAAEILVRAGFDWLIVDLEHGNGAEADLLAQLLAIQATPTAGLVRVPSSERLRIGRTLDLGADGLMIPRIDTSEQAAEALSWMRYPPAGIRGVALPTRGAGYGTVGHADVAGLDERILGIFQVESPVAVERAADIAALDGVDVLFVGPADLSHSMGIPGRIGEPSFVAALDRVVAACRGSGKAAGILLRDAAGVPEALAQGFTFIGVGSDAMFLIGSAAASAAEARRGLTAT